MFIWLTLLYLAQIIHCEEFCNGEILKDLKTNKEFANKDEFCENKPCLLRLCSQNHITSVSQNNMLIVFKNNTIWCDTIENVEKKTQINFDLPKLFPVYKTNYLENNKKSERNLLRDFRHVMFKNSNMSKSKCSDLLSYDSKYYKILEDGSLLVELPNLNSKGWLIPKRNFIMEFAIKQESSGEWTQPFLKVKHLKQEVERSDVNIIYFNATGMAISCFFLILVLVIYGLLRYLSNLAGLMLIAYMSCLTVFSGLKATQIFVRLTVVYSKDSTTFCQWTSPIVYFALLASFFWMNVMAFDTWWTFRATFKVRQINNRGIYHKFCMYCLYAFGVPLVITTGAQIIDLMDLTNYPNVLKPKFNSCLNSENTQRYVYIPIMILFSGNLMFFLMTSFNIWRIKRDMSRQCNNMDSTNSKKNQSRFMMYVKLSVLTGVNWILDFISVCVKLPPWLEYILGTNVLQGLGIFVLFVCNRKTWLMLCKRFSIKTRFVDRTTTVKSHGKSSKTSSQHNEAD